MHPTTRVSTNIYTQIRPPTRHKSYILGKILPTRHISYIGVRDCPYGICCPWVRGGWDLDALGKFFRRRRRRRRRRPRLTNRFSKCVALLHTLAHCSILRFFHKRGQNKRWGAVRHVKRSRISIRVYLVSENIVTISKYSHK